MYPSIERTSFSSKPAVRMRISSGTSPPGKRVALVSESTTRKHLAAFLDRKYEIRSVIPAQRADVAPIDRRHRCHVAGAEAFELANLDAFQADHVRGFLDRRVDLVGLAHMASDARAHVHVTRP